MKDDILEVFAHTPMYNPRRLHLIIKIFKKKTLIRFKFYSGKGFPCICIAIKMFTEIQIVFKLAQFQRIGKADSSLYAHYYAK